MRYDEDVSFEMRSGNLTAYGVERLLSQKYLVANNLIEVGGWSEASDIRLAGGEAELGKRSSFGRGIGRVPGGPDISIQFNSIQFTSKSVGRINSISRLEVEWIGSRLFGLSALCLLARIDLLLFDCFAGWRYFRLNVCIRTKCLSGCLYGWLSDFLLSLTQMPLAVVAASLCLAKDVFVV